ncbi:vWA domain-containing protein [Cellulosimicrobium marinum]|uniref:vWA domain-containing protein n=1 Tax=Cellulosimicrobium marinum TaxID=1638992 RepID=UPI001E43511B|nr:VWA domain-containing protein [Cellulosimicrobium marinum]MCB7134979.1 VWA domain-containing protein [Cellulosimicrobium marinum]
MVSLPAGGLARAVVLAADDAPVPGPQDPAVLWPWVWAGVVVAVLAVAGAGWWFARRRARERAADVLWVANSDYLADVPEVGAWVRRYRLLQGATALGLLVAVVGAGAVAARPAQTDVVVDRLGTRDIVLCLDVSGSMIAYDGAVLRVFQEMVDSFEGERIALSIFNSSSRTVFPLTNDYALVHEELQAGIDALDEDPAEFDYTGGSDDAQILEFAQFTAGTTANLAGASLIGDGLASCALQFDAQDTERSRSIILATDNYVSGQPIYTLPQAAELVSSRDITLHGIFGGSQRYEGTPEESEYRQTVEAGGGLYFLADDPAAVQGMVDDVVAQQAVELDASPEVIVTDTPAAWFGVTVAGVGLLLVVAWRVRQ